MTFEFRRALGMTATVAVTFHVLTGLAGAQYEDDLGDSGGSFGDADGSFEEPAFSINGMFKLQLGAFVPLLSSGFRPHENKAFVEDTTGNRVRACDPVTAPNKPCYPSNHGQRPGSPSIGRGTLQLEAHWDANDEVALHAIARGVRSMSLPADQYAQVPVPPLDVSLRKRYAQDWVHDNYYEELELRELYLDLTPYQWLSFRIGRQQVAWGETGQYRLLDVVNPVDNTWHFGALESFEDQRIPLWMWLTAIDFASIDATLELLWIPLIDKPEDTVSVPLTFVGAWGLPYPNTPSPFLIDDKDMLYPGGEPSDMRAGLRWKGPIGDKSTYSLVYMYTHQMSPPVPMRFYQSEIAPGVFDPNHLSKLELEFPRQHIFGGSIDYTFESPIGMVARLEAAVEPDRTYPLRSDVTSGTGGQRADDDVPGLFHFEPTEEIAVSYAVVLMRPTMIRFLNPTQNFLLVAQFMHTWVPTLDERKDWAAVEIPGYNDIEALEHSFRLIFAMSTNYMHGLITPKLVAVYVPKDSAFYSVDVGFRFGPQYRLNVTMTDFIGLRPYDGLGLFRDRDEVTAALTVLF
jgi:hypothetical protein